MKLSRQYLLGLGSGLILSALITLLFTLSMTESPSTAGADTTEITTPSVQQPSDSHQKTSSSGKSGSENITQIQKNFVIPPGASADKIAQLLQSEGWIQNKDDFLTLVKAKKFEKRFKAGTYELTPGLSIENTINQLIQ